MELREAQKSSSKKRKQPTPETGPFVLRNLIEDLPLAAEGDRDDIEINCVEFLGMVLMNPVTAGITLIFVLELIHSQQTQISTLELPPPRSSILYKYLQILKILEESPNIS
jgi:hypothetical protein